MDIQLSKDTERKLVHSIQRYLEEHLDTEVGELKARLFLKYCLEEVGACVYNHAIADAQRYFQERTADLENTCFATEFGYWNKSAGKDPAHHPGSGRGIP